MISRIHKRSRAAASSSRLAVTCLVMLTVFSGLGIAKSGAVETAPPSSPLDRFPGLGRTRSPALRDETIAYWEAFRREGSIQQCLKKAGFSDYVPEVAFPSGPTIAIAQSLGVKPDTKTPPNKRNAFIAQLPRPIADQFFKALLGASLEEINNFEKTGEVPIGASPGSFGRGGCVGRADKEIPSIWSTKRALADELNEMRASSAKEASPQYQNCLERFQVAASNPSEVEGLVAAEMPGPPEAVYVTSALNECASTWTEGYRRAEAKAANELIARNDSLLDQVAGKYDDTMTVIKNDREFLAYLGVTAAEVARQSN